MMFLDAAPVVRAIAQAMRWLPDQDEEPHQPGELPPREQKLLLMRLAALFGPDALAFSPRSPRKTSEADVRGRRPAGAYARGCRGRSSLGRGSSGATHSYDEVTQMVNRNANPDSIARRIRGSQWRLVDRSESGCRLIAPAKEAPTRLGDLLAFKDGEGWSLAVVRRMQRLHVDEITCGVEIIANRTVRVLLRSWVAPTMAAAQASTVGFGLYLPEHPDIASNTPQPDRARGSLPSWRHGRTRYRQRALSDPIHADARAAIGVGAWATFSAVRKLSA